MATKHLNYIPYPTPMAFHCATSMFVRAICGPFGSGKSVTCVQELMYIAMRQAPAADGNRYVRFGIVRADRDDDDGATGHLPHRTDAA